jgi:hypothetical protein
LPFKDIAPARTIGMAWRKHTAREQCIVAINQQIKRLVG